MVDGIQWTCDVCQRTIADGLGYLLIEPDDVSSYREARGAWVAEHQDGYSSAELMTAPKPPHWRMLHRACDPDPDPAYDYWIAVERICTLADIVNWTAHLYSKNWFSDTSWDVVLRMALESVHVPVGL